jgi:glycosyltransferase involved in cell wall biosynthesis
VSLRDDDSVLDIYGPVAPDFEAHFFEVVARNPKVRYMGVIPNKQVIDTLSRYDVLLFPSSYPGEGFPGILLEGAYAGIYCLASDHLYNKEVIENYCRGEVVALQHFVSRAASITLNCVQVSRGGFMPPPEYDDLVSQCDIL